MKLLRVYIISAKTCGGLLDGLDLRLRSPLSDYSAFDPLCLIGPNGAGKSQFLQVLAEIFQCVFHRCIGKEERLEGNPDLLFELEYLIHREDDQLDQLPIRVRISRKATGRNRPTLVIERRDEDEYDWIDCALNDPMTHALLPHKIVGYTSGDNETFSLPFLVSRSGYADEVGRRALDAATRDRPVPDTRLMLIDYGTHLEVLVANLLLGDVPQWEALLQDAQMLFGYPLSATQENWLHECLCDILRSIHGSLQAAKTPPTWPEIIPDKYRKRLQKRTGLKDRLKTYQSTVEKLATAEQKRIIQALHDQNEIALLLSCQRNCEAIADLPKPIREPVKELFKFAFELLTDLEIRDRHYKVIYDAVPSHTCPFCGCENFDAPRVPREALDHYLAESKYPFAASNLRNLVPMGNKCNSRYKLAKDILTRDDGTRRKSFDPYDCTGIILSLENSQPFAGTLTPTGQQLPRWIIEFSPNTEEVITWDEVFHIQERYEKDVLDPKFKSWLDDFKHWCKSAKIVPNSDQELMDGIDRYATLYEDMGISDRAFLKAAVFRMLHTHCNQGDQRLISLIRHVIGGGTHTAS